MSGTADSHHADSDVAGSEVADCWLTGSQAVAILNVSRKFLLDLARDGEIESHVDASGRRVYSARSVQAYLKRDDAERKQAADDLTRIGQEIQPLTSDDFAALAANSREITEDEWSAFDSAIAECRGTATDAHTRAMAIAEGRDTDPDDRADSIEVFNGTEWVRANAAMLAADLAAVTNERDALKREVAMFHAREQDDTWQQQATKIAQQAKEIGILRDKIREYDAAIGFEITCLSCTRTLNRSLAETARAEKAEAALMRVRELAGRWQYVQTKRDASKQILEALDGRKAADRG